MSDICKKRPIFRELEKCATKEELDSVFDKFGVTSFDERVLYLELCMGFEFSSKGVPSDATPEDEYEFECAVFVDGAWRDELKLGAALDYHSPQPAQKKLI